MITVLTLRRRQRSLQPFSGNTNTYKASNAVSVNGNTYKTNVHSKLIAVKIYDVIVSNEQVINVTNKWSEHNY